MCSFFSEEIMEVTSTRTESEEKEDTVTPVIPTDEIPAEQHLDNITKTSDNENDDKGNEVNVGVVRKGENNECEDVTVVRGVRSPGGDSSVNLEPGEALDGEAEPGEALDGEAETTLLPGTVDGEWLSHYCLVVLVFCF